MKYRLIVKEEAARETIESFLWYESQQQGLGNDFLIRVQDSMNFIIRKPFAFQKIFKEFRQMPVSRFPYVILYEVEYESVIVYAVFHTGRNPEIKFRK